MAHDAKSDKPDRPNSAAAPVFRSAAESLTAGRALRKKVPRESHARWEPPADRPDPVTLLIESSRGRIPQLLPIRYGRMLKSPFAFLRGAAAVMAADLAHTPTTGMRVQACGDCHIMNFGAFATPERNLIFDINDFDETLPAPWEWDVKRLSASVAVASRYAGFKLKDQDRAVRAAVRSYREQMHEYSEMPVLDVWYQHIDFKALAKKIPHEDERRRTKGQIQRARRENMPAHIFPKLTIRKDQAPKITDNPPLIFHRKGQQRAADAKQADHVFKLYRQSLPAHLRVLFDRFKYCDMAIKVVGVGSVGTFCAVALFMAADDEPLFLQIKEARSSVLEPYTWANSFASNGERVVVGQRLMQAASDIFLGWTAGLDQHRHFYIRQLRDMKMSMGIERTPRIWLIARRPADGLLRAPTLARGTGSRWPATWARATLSTAPSQNLPLNTRIRRNATMQRWLRRSKLGESRQSACETPQARCLLNLLET